MIMLAFLVLCLESTRCLQKMYEKRKRLKRALHYLPSEELSKLNNRVDCVETPREDTEDCLDRDTTEGHAIHLMEDNNVNNS